MLMGRKLLLQDQNTFSDQVWSSAGTYTKYLPQGKYRIRMRGAGGAGGYSGVSSTGAGGNGGAGANGYYMEVDLLVKSPLLYPLTLVVGAGGNLQNNGGGGGAALDNTGGRGGAGGAGGYGSVIVIDARSANQVEWSNVNWFGGYGQAHTAGLGYGILGGGGGGGGGGGAHQGRYSSGSGGGGGGGAYNFTSTLAYNNLPGAAGGNSCGGRYGPYNGDAGGTTNYWDTGVHAGVGGYGNNGNTAVCYPGAGGKGWGAGGGGGGYGSGNHSGAWGGGGGGGAPGTPNGHGGQGGIGGASDRRAGNGASFTTTPSALNDPWGNAAAVGTWGRGGNINGGRGGAGWIRITKIG